MLKPIMLTKHGEMLNPHPSNEQNFDMFIAKRYRFYIGFHAVCGGCVDIMPVAEKFNAIICRNCKLRVVIPKKVKTWEELRAWCCLAIEIEAERERRVERRYE